jgi:hypothetical protein
LNEEAWPRFYVFTRLVVIRYSVSSLALDSRQHFAFSTSPFSGDATWHRVEQALLGKEAFHSARREHLRKESCSRLLRESCVPPVWR